VDLK